MSAIVFLLAAALMFPAGSVEKAFNGHDGALVVLDSAGKAVLQYNKKGCAEKLPPCSTFKIWNTAIGLETGIVSDPDALFWKWDGKKYWLDAWNHDQTLRSAFSISCVPAYQALARRIRAVRMAEYLHKLSYGDENISSGIDVFWLPAPGRKTLLISPNEQAKMIARLVSGRLPLSSHTVAVMKDVMKVKQTANGTLYGKTGSGSIDDGMVAIGWFVGYVESGGETYPFACVLTAKDITGKEAREMVEKVFSDAHLL